MGRYKNWIVCEDLDKKFIAVEDDHKGMDKLMREKGFKILGTPLAPTAADAIDYVATFRD